MIVDTSAVVSILIDESDAAIMMAALAEAGSARLSAGSWIELTAVLVRQHSHVTKADVTDLMTTFHIAIAPVTVEQSRIGEAAYRDYGRGTGHKAALNFGDCFAYALAKETGEPLLFKGNDFSQTDIVSALKPLPPHAGADPAGR